MRRNQRRHYRKACLARGRGTGILLALTLACSAAAEVQVFEQNVVIVMGRRETQEDVRFIALQEAKRLVLEKVGTYLTGSTEIVQRVRESERGVSDETELNKHTQAITVGVTKTEIIGEWWVPREGALACSLTCKIAVDPDDVMKRLDALLLDKQKAADYEALNSEVDRLRNDMVELRERLEKAPQEQAKEVKQAIKQTTMAFSAADWFQKGLEADDLDARIAAYNEAIRLNPGWGSPYNNRGIAYANRRLYDRAIEDFDRAIALDPKQVFPYNNRGGAYMDKGLYDRAIEDFDRALILDPKYPQAYSNRGNAYCGKGFYGRAIDDYDSAIALDPKFADAYGNRGNAYYLKGIYDRAIDDYDRAIALNAKYPRAYINRGNAYIGKGHYDLAIEDFDKAIAINPNNPEFAPAYAGRGWAYFEKGLYDKTIEDCNQALVLEPNNAAAINNRGAAYYKKGLYDRAISDCDSAIFLYPQLGEAHYWRGLTYLAKGDTATARTSLEQARDLGYLDAEGELQKLK